MRPGLSGAAARAGSVERGETFGRAVGRFEPRVHRAHHDAVGERERSELQRLEEAGIGGHRIAVGVEARHYRVRAALRQGSGAPVAIDRGAKNFAKRRARWQASPIGTGPTS
jgi:hypothetical protein